MKNSSSHIANIEGALRSALTDIINDAAFMHHLAEELADRLDGFEDERFAKFLEESENFSLVSEAEVMAALKP